MSPATPWKGVDEGKVEGFLDRARQGIHCSLFCGGVKCKHEDWSLYIQRKNVHPAVEGLNTNWVSDCIVASQRPSTSLFLKYKLIPQFKAKSITGVFNLQEKGEHSSCGPDGIYAKSGYSYHGEEDLMRHGISYYEFPWPDMTAPDTDIVLRSVQVMDYHIRNSGKVLVHCHAGLGRTGLMIACYFVYAQRMAAADAIQLVRISRPGAVQTSRQVAFVTEFEKHLWRLFQAFRVEISDTPIDLASYMKRQRLWLHGEESRMYKYVPHHTHKICCRLIALAADDRLMAVVCLESFSPAASVDDGYIAGLRMATNHGRFDTRRVADLPTLSYLLLDWFRAMSEPILDAATCDMLVAYMRQPATTRKSLEDFLQFLPKYIRHLVGMLCSCVFIIGRKVHDALRRYAFRCLTDALTHARVPAYARLSPQELSLLEDFFYEWSASVGAMYFEDTALTPGHRTIAAICQASSFELDEAGVNYAPVGRSKLVDDVAPEET